MNISKTEYLRVGENTINDMQLGKILLKFVLALNTWG